MPSRALVAAALLALSASALSLQSEAGADRKPKPHLAGGAAPAKLAAGREVGRRARVERGKHKPIVLQKYPAVQPCGHDNATKASAVCGGSNRFPPELVSADPAELSKYKSTICTASDGVEEPPHELTVAYTQVTGGQTCVFTPTTMAEGGLNMFREVWNSSHTMLLGDTSGLNFMSGPQRRLAMGNKRSKMDVDENLLIVPYAHFHSIYAHALMDFLPQAYSTVDFVRKRMLRIAVGSHLEKRLLLAAGLEKRHIATVEVMEDQVICVKPGRSIYVMETLAGDTTDYYYHRMLGYRGVGEKLAADMYGKDIAQRLKNTSRSKAVVYLGRCGAAARGMENEDAAFEMVKSMMQRKGRTEELVRFCGEAFKPEVQAAALSRATAVIGPHGGAMANLLYFSPGCKAHVVEFVQSTPFVPPGNAMPPQNRYKSFYYFGMGAPFDYKLVLMEKSNSSGLLQVRLKDLEAALNKIW